MRVSVQIHRGIESLFGTRDENIRVLENGLKIRTRLLDDALEIEGEAPQVQRAERILEDYVSLVQQGQTFSNGDLNSYLRVLMADSEASLRGLVESGRSRNFGKKMIAPKTANQRRYLDALERKDLVFGIGPAGTGKTYLAVAMGVSALLSKRVSRIILTRPAVEAGERLGFLPGTLQQKVDPYLRPLYDALYDMVELDKVERFLEKGIIEVAPIAFMRGRTLNDSFIILDEAQNSTPEQMKMVLTRQGFNSKMVVTGDVTQIDLPSGKQSGLLQAVEVLGKVEGIGFIYFDETDVVRHSLVQRIVKAYERYDEAIGRNRQLNFRWGEAERPNNGRAESAPLAGEASASEAGVEALPPLDVTRR
jgi:phosphate starvation-inducible PhoH-like protein